MRRIGLLVALCAALMVSLPGSALGYSRGDLMENAVMNNVNSMSLPEIETFLSKSPCLAHYTGRSFSWNGQEWVYGSETWNAARIVYEAAHFWGLNPQVTLAKMQEEESLVTGTSCDLWRYASAMGYACPEASGCNPRYAGFEFQILFGDFQIKFNEERSFGNLAYAEEGALVYSGLMLKGMFARCESCKLETFSGIAVVGGQEVYLETAPTAALLSYTPNVDSVLNEMSIFESYGFGSTVAGQVGLVEPKSEPPPKEEPVEEPPVEKPVEEKPVEKVEPKKEPEKKSEPEPAPKTPVTELKSEPELKVVPPVGATQVLTAQIVSATPTVEPATMPVVSQPTAKPKPKPKAKPCQRTKKHRCRPKPKKKPKAKKKR